MRDNRVKVNEIATLPKSTTKTFVTIVHWHWIAARHHIVLAGKRLGRPRIEQSGVLLQHEASNRRPSVPTW